MPIDRVVISGRLYNQLVQNRIYVQCEQFQEVDEVAAHIWNSWINTLRQQQTQSLRYSEVVVTRIEPPSNTSFSDVRSVLGFHQEEPQALSFGAGVIRFQTGLAGRQNRGRYYAAGYRQGATFLGQFTADELTQWKAKTDLLQEFYTGPSGGSTGLNLLIRHEKAGGFTAVTSIAMRPIIGVVRRRNIGVGA